MKKKQLKKVFLIMFGFFLAASMGLGLSQTELYKGSFSPTTGVGGVSLEEAQAHQAKNMTHEEAEELVDEIKAAKQEFSNLKSANNANFSKIENDTAAGNYDSAEITVETSKTNLATMMQVIRNIEKNTRMLTRYVNAQEDKAYIELPKVIDFYEYASEANQAKYDELAEELGHLERREEQLWSNLYNVNTNWLDKIDTRTEIARDKMGHTIESDTYYLQLNHVRHSTIKRKSEIINILVNFTHILEKYMGNVVESRSKLEDYKKDQLINYADNVLQIHLDLKDNVFPHLLAVADQDIKDVEAVKSNIEDQIDTLQAQQRDISRQMETIKDQALDDEASAKIQALIDEVDEQIEEALSNARAIQHEINSVNINQLYSDHTDQSNRLNALEYTLALAKAEVEMEEYDDEIEDEEEDDYEENNDDDDDQDYEDVDLKIHSLNYDEDDHELEIRICADDLNEYTEVRIEWDIENDDYDQITSLDDSDCPGRGIKLSLDRFDIDEGDYFDVNVKLVALDFDENNTSNNRDSEQFQREEEESHKRDHDDDDDEKEDREDDDDDRYDYDYDYDYNDNEVFRDISGHWSEEYVMEAYDRGWVNGTSKGRFEPNRRVNAAEFVKMLAETAEYGSRTGQSDFSIYIPSWANGYLVALEKDDVVRVRDGLIQDFNESITRCDAALYIARAYGVTKYLDDGENPFRDVRDSSYCAYAIVALYELDIVDGYGDDTFKPFQYLTRAEALTLLMKARDI